MPKRKIYPKCKKTMHLTLTGRNTAERAQGGRRQALRDICAGKPLILPPYVVDEFERKTAEVSQEISLCWRQGI